MAGDVRFNTADIMIRNDENRRRGRDRSFGPEEHRSLLGKLGSERRRRSSPPAAVELQRRGTC
jgi:hypothetical protein